ncbi:hypothetical protein ACFXAZ_21600 [Streptomyces sp. NPDC059477]|uniref:hypothetical protein n=1 Tax=Streptomyces sp. NPDC059477 TaxID=3346847 RepID=UPI0036AA2D2F
MATKKPDVASYAAVKPPTMLSHGELPYPAGTLVEDPAKPSVETGSTLNHQQQMRSS